MDEEDTMLLRNPKGEPAEVKSLITKNGESYPESELATPCTQTENMPKCWSDPDS